MKSFPKRANVLGQVFRVELVPNLKDEDGQDCYGLTNGAEKLIRICKSKCKTDQERESVLLHELVHACLYVAGVSELLDGKVEEGLVLCLEHGLGGLYQRR